MPRAPQLRVGQRVALPAGPFKGVLYLKDPYAVPSNYLANARNVYLRDASGGSGVAERPGFYLANAVQLGDATSRIGQGICTLPTEDGTWLNFLCVGGHLYRGSADLSVWTEVSPAGITLDPGNPVHMTSFVNQLLVNDDLNTPWYGTALTSAPITGTKVDYEGDASDWRAYGPWRIYENAAAILVRYTRSEARLTRFAWSEPSDMTLGFHQSGGALNYDNEWDLIQNSDEAIYCLWPTNQDLRYFRNRGIGYAAGAFEDFQTTATHDGIDQEIGMRSAAIVGVSPDASTVFFVDTEGRPMAIVNDQVSEIWKQMRAAVDPAPTHWPDVNARVQGAVSVPELRTVLLALWSADPTQAVPQFPTTVHAFDGPSLKYCGDWKIADGIAIHCMGLLTGPDGEKVLAVLGSGSAPTGAQVETDGGWLWLLHNVEDGVLEDNGIVPEVYWDLPLLGFDPDLDLYIDQVSAVMEEVQNDPTGVDVEIVAG